MRFILKSLLFIGLASYFMPKGNDDSFVSEAGGALVSVFNSFTKDIYTKETPPKPQGRNTLNADDLNPPWQGRVKRL